MIYLAWVGLARVLFFDRVRPVELFSGLNLIAWAVLLTTTPELLERDSYQVFDYLGRSFWIAGLVTIALLQMSPILWPSRYSDDIRLLALAFSAGVWLMIGLNFVFSGVTSTAQANYFLLAVLCAAAGAYLAWTSHKSSSI